jgi:hypothetical protein
MCFSLAWLQQILIWAVIIGAIFAIVRLLLPMALSQLGGAGSTLLQIINIVMWAFICIVVIYIAFGLISCLAGSGTLSLPRVH